MPARAPTPRRRSLAVVAAAALAAVASVLALRPGPAAAPAAPAPPAAPNAERAPEAPAPVALAAPVPAEPAAPPAPAAPASRPAASEEDLMERLRADVDERPDVAIALAEQGEELFPSGRYADERSWLHMRALVHLGDIGKARTVAEAFFERHPESPLGRSVFRLTGMRPRPRLGPPS
jgi:hypothetical protein